MKFGKTKRLAILALASMIGVGALATPAEARWWDGYRYHYGPVPYGWHYSHRYGYYVYSPAYVSPPPVVIAPPQPAYYGPPPVYYAPPPPAYGYGPGVSLGVHIR